MTKKKKTDFYLLRRKSISEGDLFVTDYIKTKQRLDKLTDELEILKLRVDNLKKDKNFLRYCYHVTPQKILEQLFIGSRPTKRKKSQDIKNLRAIPWVFAWTQIRFILPAWLGTLEALNIAKENKNQIANAYEEHSI